ncbi:dynein heavy chain binding protein [Aureococcus anophagefferens]|nr:dynein heavy chain binding protein [Aureococcus anophagefferens]
MVHLRENGSAPDLDGAVLLPVYSIDMPSTYSAEDDYGDDFEDYDDDFCEVELQAPAPPSKQQMSTLTGASKKKEVRPGEPWAT